MKLDRKKQPDFRTLEKITFPKAKIKRLGNDIPVYLIDAGTQDIVKIDIIFKAGSLNQQKKLIASTTNDMLIEGSKNYSSAVIAEKIDFYGSFIQMNTTKDFASVSLFSLNKYLKESLNIVSDFIINPLFPKSELNTFLNKKKQQFAIELSKVNTIARLELNKGIFGENHPYGNHPVVEDYKKVLEDDLIQFHQDNYTSDNCFIIVSGKIKQDTYNIINQHLGEIKISSRADKPVNAGDFITIKDKFIHKPKTDAFQSAIRIGTRIFNKQNPDFARLNVLNTILGGYFGSRLMKNIREEKGLTYGIGSFIIPLRLSGYFTIASEVNAEATKAAIEAIHEEIKKLRNESVKPDELEIVKNYMFGEILRSFDGPFAIASKYRTLIEQGLSVDYFENNLQIIRDITPDELLIIANKYLVEESLITVVAGKYQ